MALVGFVLLTVWQAPPLSWSRSVRSAGWVWRSPRRGKYHAFRLKFRPQGNHHVAARLAWPRNNVIMPVLVAG